MKTDTRILHEISIEFESFLLEEINSGKKTVEEIESRDYYHEDETASYISTEIRTLKRILRKFRKIRERKLKAR